MLIAALLIIFSPFIIGFIAQILAAVWSDFDEWLTDLAMETDYEP